MLGQYQFTENMMQLYRCIQDDLSRDIFWARLRYDIEEPLGNENQMWMLDILSGAYAKEDLEQMQNWESRFIGEQLKIILYGIGAFGLQTAIRILRNGGDFWGFCDKKAQDTMNLRVLDKPVFPPQYLLEHANSCCVLITSVTYYDEIMGFLRHNQFPESHIIPGCFGKYASIRKTVWGNQYFSFPELYKKGTAFVDAGCLDGGDSIRFAEWCGGEFSEILAFEPNFNAYLQCNAKMEAANIGTFRLFNKGLGSITKTVSFSNSSNGSSHIANFAQIKQSLELLRVEDDLSQVEIIPLDTVTKDLTVGFIKMDIEGAELDALYGAQETILRDKPFLAICAYHRQGDVIAIMDFLHKLVPEYRFWLRHYAPFATETVLYAAL